MRRCVDREKGVGSVFTIRRNQLHIETMLVEDLEVLRDEQREFPNPSRPRATHTGPFSKSVECYHASGPYFERHYLWPGALILAGKYPTENGWRDGTGSDPAMSMQFKVEDLARSGGAPEE